MDEEKGQLPYNLTYLHPYILKLSFLQNRGHVNFIYYIYYNIYNI